MIQILLVGVGAGAASALLYASIATGSALATVLFYVAALPILIAALGWTHWAGLVAGFTAAASLGLGLGTDFFLTFLLSIALPAWWLSYLAMLARPVGSNGSLTLEWYPVGRIVLWATLISAVLVIMVVGTDKENFQKALRELFEKALQTRPTTELPGTDTDRVLGLVIAIIPPAAAIFLTLVSVFNLWLAARIVRLSGRLNRPWPDLSATTLPPIAIALLAIAVFGSLLPDPPGTLSGVLAASLITAYAILGFAVLHAATRGGNFRTYVLFATYFTIAVSVVPLLGLPLLVMAMLGVADTAFNIRKRIAQNRGPPHPPASIHPL